MLMLIFRRSQPVYRVDDLFEAAMINIESNRIFLRDYAMDGSDLENILRFTGDAEVATHSSWGPLTRDETLEYLNNSLLAIDTQPRMSFALALVLKSSGDLI